jgi:hypothetical protein
MSNFGGSAASYGPGVQDERGAIHVAPLFRSNFGFPCGDARLDFTDCMRFSSRESASVQGVTIQAVCTAQSLAHERRPES